MSFIKTVGEYATKACQCLMNIHFRSTSDPKLLTYDKVPIFLRNNCYILSGYRAYFTVQQCVNSLFRWTNETLNIWTHVFGFLIFYTLLYKELYLSDDLKLTFNDRLINYYLIVSYMVTLGLSVIYHTFCCVSEKCYSRCCCWDLSGIVLAFAASFVTSVYYTFYCFPVTMYFYLTLVLASSLGLLWFLMKACNFLDKTKEKTRIMVFTVWVGMGVVPTVHWVVMEGNFDSAKVLIFLPKILTLYVIGGVALAFYLSHFPERCLPGRFDYVGHSHQLWHVLIVLSMLWWHRSVNQLSHYQTRNSTC